MKILISGLSGFVGHNLKNYLSISNNNFKIVSIDREILNTPNKLESLTYGADVFIHLAGKAHDFKTTRDSQEYYRINTELTKFIFDIYVKSNIKKFIILSSVKAVADSIDFELTEEYLPNPLTHYGKSKLLAENYILNKSIPDSKRVYILRPCMIHGPGNKGNLNILYKSVSYGIPWPLGAFHNKRSLCSIENLCFVIKELIERNDIQAGIYNISDNNPVSTNELIKLIANSKNRQAKILNIPKFIIIFISKIGNSLKLPLNTDRLQKLTESYMVSNKKILMALGKKFPVSSKEGLIKTFQSFSN